MIEMGQTSRRFWHDALAAGGFTRIPRWTLDPTRGVAEHEIELPSDLVEALLALARELSIPVRTILLAAHAKVLAALVGEQEVKTGYVVSAVRRALPCRLTTESETWRALLRDVHRVESELMEHQDFPFEDLERELDLTQSQYECVFNPIGNTGVLADGVVLQVSVVQRGGRLALRLQYRTEAMNAESAARIGSYHRTALASMVADPDAEHRRQSLLSAEELDFQVEGLAGPRRQLPDRRFHELFEERVAADPDAIAAVQRDRSWTYRELNARANMLGRALLTRGLRPEDVVAVVTERNLDWMAAVLAIFKAGAVYLPIEPHFPPDRIANMLSRAECGLVLTEAGSTTTLDQALDTLSNIDKLFIDAAYEEDHADGDLGVAVPAHQVAYIYFTSGSTGEPKGAMCEHAGMINHLYAKVDDFGIADGQVVAQIAPQCFDISLWQLVSALLVGGRTVIIDQPTILDVERFLEEIVEQKIAVMQVVPSYLEVVLSYLEQSPRELPDLRCVSVTGEAVTKELVQRWFAAKPSIQLANAYGLTETSDDTNHEVMDRAPEGERVPLGRAINNAYVYVVDEHLSPVPLGAPGEIVFSGVCVGRGYINDPERTRLAFMDDPIRAGERLYRSGDYGFWRADGKLEFLGRRDAQVKIRGFRIEIGEIENRLSRVDGVRRAAVVVAERADQSKQLVAFYSGEGPLDVETLQEQLGRSLPTYMVPSALHWQEELPHTANGKIDKKRLAALAVVLDEVGEFQAPHTESERRLAVAWAQVLGVPQEQVSREDHFFDRGGTSLSAVKLVVALDRAVSLKDVTRNPVLSDLARLLDGKSERRAELLQSLSEPEGTPGAVLVCLPYAGGNAVNFQPMAQALRGSGLAVYAAELPGHDLAAESEPFAPMDHVVEQLAEEITQRGVPRVFLWGHSSGAALALETTRALKKRGVHVERVFIGAQLLGDAANRNASVDALRARSDAEVAARLDADRDDSERGTLDAQRAAHMGAAYRHDYMTAHRYFVGALEDPPAAKLESPVTVVVASDDPATAGYAQRHADWELVAAHVDLHELADGGHYFLRTRPIEAVQPVLRAAASMTFATEPTKRGDRHVVPDAAP